MMIYAHRSYFGLYFLVRGGQIVARGLTLKEARTFAWTGVVAETPS